MAESREPCPILAICLDTRGLLHASPAHRHTSAACGTGRRELYSSLDDIKFALQSREASASGAANESTGYTQGRMPAMNSASDA